MKLVGAKEFLRLAKPGTVFVEYWMKDEDECFEIIKRFEKGENILEDGEWLIFGSNACALSYLKDEDNEIVIIDGHKYDYLFAYDHNVIGDASPWTTLYLIFEDDIPEKTIFGDKEDLKRIIKWFIESEGPFAINDFDDPWIKEFFKRNKDDKIINYKGEEDVKR